MEIDHLYSAEEVGKLLTLKTKTVQRKCAAGEWPHIRLPGYGGGHRYVFTEAQLRELLDMMTVTVAPPRAPRKATQARQKTAR